MSDQPQRAFSTAFKESVVLRLRAGERLAAVAEELAIEAGVPWAWVTVMVWTGAPGDRQEV